MEQNIAMEPPVEDPWNKFKRTGVVSDSDLRVMIRETTLVIRILEKRDRNKFYLALAELRRDLSTLEDIRFARKNFR